MRSSRRWRRDGIVQQKMRVHRDSRRCVRAVWPASSRCPQPTRRPQLWHPRNMSTGDWRSSCLGFGLGLVTCCICGRLYPKVQAKRLPPLPSPSPCATVVGSHYGKLIFALEKQNKATFPPVPRPHSSLSHTHTHTHDYTMSWVQQQHQLQFQFQFLPHVLCAVAEVTNVVRWILSANAFRVQK